jgi:thiamine-monophosphate kinase
MKIFTTAPGKNVAAMGEVRLIAAVRRWLGDVSPHTPFGIGDDCAVLPGTKRAQLVTTDPVIYGQHFDESVSARSAGAKLLKRNLSDIAAMGGRPVAAVLSLAMAPTTSTEWLRGFYLGLATVARRYHVKIVGGDITQAPAGFFGAFLTLHGEATGPRVVTRTGARCGDILCVTGRLGGSRGGHHYDFQPRLAEGKWLAGRAEVVAMMDLSDGIAKDVQSLTPPGLLAAVLSEDLPVSAAARKAARRSGRPDWHHALTDGEDYELLIVIKGNTATDKFLQAWHRRFRTPLSPMGIFSTQLTSAHVDWRALHGYEHLTR